MAIKAEFSEYFCYENTWWRFGAVYTTVFNIKPFMQSDSSFTHDSAVTAQTFETS